ncbi:spike base protein, RCAP_Rcc01079 family [Rhizobium sp. C1]|uniref:spike base protein, RCAP_Rcc01079 family n=1 Tax=Rhizobium sp. C1 TaxID=1349799 RepID=UPI001E45842B|nr:hypothetical protein [Rhizobium sp. C1]MCD2180228.1 hypothetical protein [Rhizobium sp. C1]
MADRFADNAPSLAGPASHAFPITPSDTTSLAETIRALYCGVGGDIAATLASGAAVIFTNVPAGAVLPVRATKIAAAGTTANALVGLV